MQCLWLKMAKARESERKCHQCRHLNESVMSSQYIEASMAAYGESVAKRQSRRQLNVNTKMSVSVKVIGVAMAA
jgi:hypothetical protein